MSEELSGRELDAAIAERLFGWGWIHHPDSDEAELCPSDIAKLLVNDYEWAYGIGGKPSDYSRAPAYSTTWEGVGMIEQAMYERGMRLGLNRGVLKLNGKWEWQAFFLPIPASTLAIGDSAPEAVARAALKALEAQS